MITVETIVDSPLAVVWEKYTQPQYVTQWNNASEDWHTPRAENDLRVGGKFVYRMEAKDGSFGFDFGGVYSEVRPEEFFAYEMDDGRKVEVGFEEVDEGVKVTVKFDPESENSEEMQRAGWQAILDNFKRYAER